MRSLVSICASLSLGIPGLTLGICALAQPAPLITLLAAVPTHRGAVHFPAEVYRIDETTRKLHLIREIVSQDEGVDFVRCYGNVITLGVPNVRVRELRIVHGSDPAKVDNVALPPATMINGTAIAADKRSGLIQVLQEYHAPTLTPEYVSILLDENAPESSKVRRNGAPSVMDKMLITGWRGGAAADLDPEGDSIYSYAARAALLFPSPPPHGTIILAVSPPESLIGKPILIACSNPKFLILRGIQVDSPSYKETSFFLYDREKKSWSTLNFAGVPKLSIFGDWLAIVGQTVQQVAPMRYGSGPLLIRNLAAGAQIQIAAAGLDHEVLSIAGNRILYRSGDKIFLGRINRNSIADISLLVQDTNVPKIHWATMTALK